MRKIVEVGEKIIDWFDEICERRPLMMTVVFLLLSVGILGFCVWLNIDIFSKRFGLIKLIIVAFCDLLAILLGGSLLLITTKNLVENLAGKRQGA